MMSNDSVNRANGTQGVDLMPKATPQKKNLGQEDFLRLMVTQVRNQDPLNTENSGDFMAQMAQFSTADGIAKMQQSLANLASSLQSSQALQASSLVGKSVAISSDQLVLREEGNVSAFIDAQAGVNDLKAVIYNDKNEVVRELPLGATTGSKMTIEWDGLNSTGNRMPKGNYRIAVTGSFQGQGVGLNTMTTGRVESVSLGQYGDGVKLNIEGIGPVAMANVSEIIA